ncbi:hypothetical protein LI328DRAFT_25285 [Trichoderma asperelloides]|nr:hypothetical protein LI328DRAFT_25285 [Trichoderma asperelloides]
MVRFARLQAAAHSQWEDASVFSGVLLPSSADPAGRRVGLRVLLQLQGPGWCSGGADVTHLMPPPPLTSPTPARALISRQPLSCQLACHARNACIAGEQRPQ